MKNKIKIKSITIKNFKAFDDFKIDFTSNKNNSELDIELGFVALTNDGTKVIPYVNAIMGRNSIGKTSLLDAIVFFADFFKNINKERAKQIFFHRKIVENMEDDDRLSRKKILKNIQEEKYISDLKKIESDLYIKEYKKYARNNKKPIEISIELDYEKNQNIKLLYPLIEQKKLEYFPDFSFENTMSNKKKESLFNDIKTWSNSIIMIKNNINDTNIWEHTYNSLEVEDVIESLINKYKTKIKSLNNLIKLANPKFIEFIKDDGALRYTEKGALLPLHIRSLSSGTQRFLHLLYYIMKFAKNKSGIILIDELEKYLHNELVNVIKIGLNTIAKKYNLQVVFTTHNPLILNNFISNKQIISLDEEGEKIISSKVSSKIKPRNNIIKKYENGEIAMYPNPEYAKSICREIFEKW